MAGVANAAEPAPPPPATTSTTASPPTKLSHAEFKQRVFELSRRLLFELPVNPGNRAYAQASAPLIAELHTLVAQAPNPNSMLTYKARLLFAYTRDRCLDEDGALKLSAQIRQNTDPFVTVLTYYLDREVYAHMGNAAALDRLVAETKRLGAPPHIMKEFTTWAADEHALPNGKPMPDFDLSDLAGTHHRLADYKGKLLVIVLASAQNPLCAQDMPRLLALYHTYHAQGVEFLTIFHDVDGSAVPAFAASHQIPWPVVHRGDWSTSQFGTAFCSRMSPDDLLIGKDATLIAKYLFEDRLEDKIKEALACTTRTPGAPARAGGF